MLSKKQADNFRASCARWLEKYLRENALRQNVTIDRVCTAGKTAGFSREQIKAARAWHGSGIVTEVVGNQINWRWEG